MLSNELLAYLLFLLIRTKKNIAFFGDDWTTWIGYCCSWNSYNMCQIVFKSIIYITRTFSSLISLKIILLSSMLLNIYIYWFSIPLLLWFLHNQRVTIMIWEIHCLFALVMQEHHGAFYVWNSAAPLGVPSEVKGGRRDRPSLGHCQTD